jgi:membrane-associated protein
MPEFIDVILHLDQHLLSWMQFFGPWLYVILFMIIFCETGLVVTPFLPGDSLLFALGALTVMENGLDLWTLLISLTIAGIMGDTVNYHIGKFLGAKVFEKDSRFFKKKHLEQTQAFYAKWGAFAIVAARFAPMVRTFVPFVAGVATMNYSRFVFYNIIGSITWVFSLILAGHFFGNIPFVKRNFHVIVLTLFLAPGLPILFAWVRSFFSKKEVNRNA